MPGLYPPRCREDTMNKVIAAITTSLDGYIVGPQDRPGQASASGASGSTTG